MGNFAEAIIIINGVEINAAQAMALRVAVTSYHAEMADENVLGDDEHGRKMTALYRARLGEILHLLLDQRATSHGGGAR